MQVLHESSVSVRGIDYLPAHCMFWWSEIKQGAPWASLLLIHAHQVHSTQSCIYRNTKGSNRCTIEENKAPPLEIKNLRETHSANQLFILNDVTSALFHFTPAGRHPCSLHPTVTWKWPKLGWFWLALALEMLDVIRNSAGRCESI